MSEVLGPWSGMRKYHEQEMLAHINDNGKTQTIKEHLMNTAELAASFSIPELERINYLIGLLHDVGK